MVVPIVDGRTCTSNRRSATRGLGARLLDSAIAYAREHDAAEAVVWPTPGSASFYRRAGFGSEAAPLGMDLAGD